MGLNTNPESSSGIMNAIKGALNIFSGLNKAEGVSENSNPQPRDIYDSKLGEEEILKLVSEWKGTYSVYYKDVEASQKLSFEYWLGKHRQEGGLDSPNTTDNLIFEAVETFLPIATRANPDPLVNADPSPIGQKLAKDIKAALVSIADKQKLRRKLARMTRHWVIYKVGIIKIGWDPVTQEITTDVVNPKMMVFDKDGYWDEGGRFRGEYLGEKKRATVQKLIELFPEKKEKILEKSRKKGTKLEYFEWWYHGTDVFFTLEEIVLGKFKNPNWNYDIPEQEADPETGLGGVQETPGVNHFKKPEAPYMGLSIFSTGLQPHDETSLVTQNIPLQDMINRRYTQIEANVKGMNNGIVVNGRAFTEEQASQAASALRRGVAIRIPSPTGGNVQNDVARLQSPGLPGDVYVNLRDAREQLRNIFGTSGSTPEGTKAQDTVRGKILVNQMDASRIGGGVTEYIEQVADSIYNYWVQMMYVYFDQEQFITTTGLQGGTELIALKNSAFPLLKSLNITVKEGSLIPKDPLTQRNEAIDLWSANAIDPISLFNKLDYPDPVGAAKQLIIWQMVARGAMPPQAYIHDFGPAAQGVAPDPTGGNAVNDLNQVPPIVPSASPESVGQESRQLIQSVPV
jgi:hypothetical protein